MFKFVNVVSNFRKNFGKPIAVRNLSGGHGAASPNREEALRFIFGIDEIDAAVVGLVTPLEVDWNLRFAAGVPSARILLDENLAP